MRKPVSGKRTEIVFSRAITMALRTEALDRSQFNCHMCGLAPGEIDWTTGRTARLYISHTLEKSVGGKNNLSNLTAVCSICKEGRKDLIAEKPTWIWLLSQIRRAGQDEQLAALNWLREKFAERN